MLKGYQERTPNVELQETLAERIYADRVEVVELEPFSGEFQSKMADASLELARLGFEGKAEEAINTCSSLAKMAPGLTEFHKHLLNSVAIAYIYLSEPKKGIALIDSMLNNNPMQSTKARALYVRGAAYYESRTPTLPLIRWRSHRMRQPTF